MSHNEPININEASFEAAVLQSPIPVMVDFWAPWCGPCRMLSPVVEELAAELSGRVRIAKVNVDDNGPLSARFGIRGIPALLFFEGGKLRETVTGAQPKKVILQKLEALLGAN